MTQRNKVAVLGVIFPEVEKFIDDYLLSLEKQTFKNFDLIIINDGFNKFGKYKYKYELNIKEIKYKNTPAKIRELGINHIREEGYEYIVFTDSDDFFSSNRIGKSIELLKHYDIVVNDLTLVSESGNILDTLYISNRIKKSSGVNLDFIIDKNIFGFSNTSMRLKCLTEKIKIKKSLIAVDWYLFTRLLLEGCSSIFTNEALSFYRIYRGNTIGLSSDIDWEKIGKIIDVKFFHYKKLSEIDTKFKHLYLKFNELKKYIKNSRCRENYIEKIKCLNINKPLWWEAIKLPEELGL